ncbi:hypothetical protein GS464_29595 [Rhodococcus hoagii]|nr:hypothetical protein [Prescottella equi]MBM4644785.1 hypothetical protein [Prescottella equi]MBM4646572.1 hypothetical protein [Prescottella equi]
MNEDYDAIQIADDAVKFAESRFGKHYISNVLVKARDAHIAAAKQSDASDAYIAREMARADEIDKTIHYFSVAQQINTDKSLRERIRAKLRRKEKADV